jgi:hypothetical protein
MTRTAAGEDSPRRWKLRGALKEKAGFSDEKIAELFTSARQLEIVELAMRVEEKFGIEIEDEDFLSSCSGEDLLDLSS